MKYSINSTGNIVAERDIYSLGGFIPKGSVGCKVANGDQISQDGECWVSSGDISGRPDVRVKDNAYIGNFAFSSGVHTDGITEFSGNTLIPRKIVVRNLLTDPVNNFFCKDSFIGISMDVLCGPVATTTAFPFEQGGFNRDVPAGTLFTSASMHTDDANICRTTASLCLGKDTYLYVPTGYACRVLWGYWNTAGQLAYSGESFAVSQALTKLEHPTYKVAMIHITRVNGTAMTPTDLLATGAKILGHISSSVLTDIRPESASGQYVMVNSSFIAETDNFGLDAIQLRLLAGSMYDTNMYTPGDSTNYKIYGTFHNVQRLEYTMYLSDSHRTNVNRDRYISAYDCPLLRVDNSTYDASLTGKGNLTLRRCIVPKAIFTDNIHNGNLYEDIDFSYASDHLGAKAGNNFDMWSSHKQGEYAAIGGGTAIAGLISRPENLAAGSILGPGIDSVPLDGSLLEQGAYRAAGVGFRYENAKSETPLRIRTGKPVKTAGLSFPSLPAGYSVKALYYLNDRFVISSTSVDPAGLDTTYPYVVMLFRKDDDSAINVTDFIALGLSLRFNNYSNVPEITGSAYVGAGCTVRGDVKLIGDPYVNRLLDVNMWERGEMGLTNGVYWENAKANIMLGIRFRTKYPIPVSINDAISAGAGYSVWCIGLDESKTVVANTGAWVSTETIKTDRIKYVVVVVRKGLDVFIEDSDIPLANVKYVRAFKKRRYITNELDRTSPEDTLIGPDYWEQGELAVATANAGKPYEELKTGSPYRVRLKRPFGFGAGYRATFSSGYSFGSTYYDAATKLLYGSTPANMDNALFTLVGRMADSPTTPITPADVTAGRLIIEFIPSPRIVTPYRLSLIVVGGAKVRMYDNAVLSKPMDAATQKGEIVLSGDAVARYDFLTDPCMCSNGHSDAIIKLP